MTTILLVDSDATALTSLATGLQTERPDWQVLKACDGTAALECLASHHSDCIISDASLEDMDTFFLLSQVRQHYPAIVRFTVSDNPDNEIVLESARANHRFFNKSLEDKLMATGIECSLRLRAVLSDDQVDTHMRSITSLPSLPAIYTNMMSELASPHSSLLNVGRIIEKDAGLTVTVLKIVNSTFYGLSQRVDSVAQAVALLGVHLIKNITLTAKVFSKFEGSVKDLSRLNALNDDALKVGALANQFARHAGVPRSAVDHSGIAGMLANIGELIGLTQQDIQQEESNTTPTEFHGAYLLRLWLMPDTIVEAVALQYESPPMQRDYVTPLIVLHAVRHLQENLVNSNDKTQYDTCLDYLSEIVDVDIARLWIDSYKDMQLLGSDIGNATKHAA